MKLPNFERATVPREKIVNYLLSDTHPHGHHKAAFFRSFGFSADNWLELAEALLAHAEKHEGVRAEDSPFGVRYVIDGIMESPDGRNPSIRAVWFIDTGGDEPRFVTAFPLKKDA
ncbi:MAG: DUF6883 domain-containing protein [Pirellulales bacterium]